MILRGVTLRDWKAYQQARFELPAPDGDRNIILIGAPNGYGKTSFFEALTLGLFGREGLPLVPRATVPAEGEAEAKLNTSYSKFLGEALHRRASSQGRLSCSVGLEFEDGGEAISLERRWHFASNGQHKPQDDELLIFEGSGRRPVGPPISENDRDGWFRAYIAQTFLPSYLAAFFLFDGEQVQRFARRDMAGQVRRGIEGLLGLPILRSLQESLRKYADNRRAQVATPSDEKVKTVQAEIAALEADLADAQKKMAEIDALLPRIEQERDDLIRELGSHGGGSVALVSELHRDEERLRAAADRALEELMALLAGDVAVALSGADLRQQTLERLQSEAVRENWEAGRIQGGNGLERFADKLTGLLKLVQPPLSPDQRYAAVAAARNAWDAIWFPPPENCASEFLHTALSGGDRIQAIARLEAAGQRSAAGLRDLVRQMREAAEGAEAKKRERLTLELNAPEAEAKAKRLQEVSEELGKLKTIKGNEERRAQASEAQLGQKRQELGRYTDSIGRGSEPLRRARQGEVIADMIGSLLEEAVPTQVDQVATAMTEAWTAMGHKKGLVKKIEITPDCDVRLLNRHGDDIRAMQLSAGEEQIFTQALIQAIAKVSGRDFPFVVDTPLARLDVDHRLGVLRHFTDREGQVILLSTDTEVVGPYLDAIRKRVLAAYRLNVRAEDGVTVTSVSEGYFERV
jgi:DNA sulfur modification protein DndD